MKPMKVELRAGRPADGSWSAKAQVYSEYGKYLGDLVGVANHRQFDRGYCDCERPECPDCDPDCDTRRRLCPDTLHAVIDRLDWLEAWAAQPGTRQNPHQMGGRVRLHEWLFCALTDNRGNVSDTWMFAETEGAEAVWLTSGKLIVLRRRDELPFTFLAEVSE